MIVKQVKVKYLPTGRVFVAKIVRTPKVLRADPNIGKFVVRETSGPYVTYLTYTDGIGFPHPSNLLDTYSTDDYEILDTSG